MASSKSLAHLYLLFTYVFSRASDAALAFWVWGSQTMLTGLFKNSSFGPSPNLHKGISLVEVYRFGQCLGWRFSPKSTFYHKFSRV